jgi:ribonuclease G
VKTELFVNVTPPETRVALTENGRAVEVFHERRQRRSLVGNVYLGRVHRVLPGMHAAFVAIGLDRDAFLYVEDVLPHSVEADLDETVELSPRGGRAGDRPRIEELLREGQDVVVQVTKDPISGKGPRVAASVSLPGRRLVYLPRARDIGISRRITDDAERSRLRQMLEPLDGPGGFIVRTAAQGAAAEELHAERLYLQEVWQRIGKKAETASPPALLLRELELPLRVARDLAGEDLDRVLVDDAGTFERLKEFMTAVAPRLSSRVELYEERQPIFDRFGIEREIESALESRVPLASGGSIVIHQTEALVAIDVNTGRFVGTDALEETVFAANCEAVPEIARQIRLRDLGGLLVVDFIDMEDPDHRRQVFESFEAELARDRSRTRSLQISEFGLVEVTRQRSRGNLERTLTRECPECDGTGRIKTDLTVALELRRAILRSETVFSPGETVRVRVRPSLARLATEEDPALFEDVETRLNIRLEFVGDPAAPIAGYEIQTG